MNKAVIVIDMLNEFIYGNKNKLLINLNQRKKLISNIKKVISLAHKKNIPIIYSNLVLTGNEPITKVIGNCCIKGTEGAEIIPELKPTKKDYISEKKGYDGFFKSNLEKLLRKLKVKEIYLVGIQTDCCVRETGVTAAHLGFDVFVIEDCCATNRPLGQKAALIFTKGAIGEVVKSNNLKW